MSKSVEDRWGRRVIARLGGVAMFSGFVSGVLLYVPLDQKALGLLAGALLVFSLGLVDDLRRMPPYTKLVLQLLIGCLVVMSGIRIELIEWMWLSIPLSILWFVLIMNAFNLLDNMDGLAAGVGAIAAGTCAVHGALAGQWAVATIAATVTGACLGFLRYNFPPAKIFMGDSGSHLLGLSLASLALMGSWRHSTQLVSVLAVPTLVLAVPIFDTCFVTIQRLRHGQHPFTGGTDHVSHRLAILGLTSRQTVLTLYAFSFCFGALSILSIHLSPVTTVLVWVVMLSVLVLIGRYLARVKVYRLEEPPHKLDRTRSTTSTRPTTLIETMLLHKRRLVEILVDFTLICSCYVFAHLLRFEGTLTSEYQRLIVQSLPLVLLMKLACFAGSGLYRGIWRHLGLRDLLVIVKAVTLGSILSSLTLLFVWRFEGYSRAVFIIDWMLSLLAIGGSRMVERLLDEWIGQLRPRGHPVLIVGAGDTGARVLRMLRSDTKTAWRVVGFLDDDPGKHGERLHGAPVLGTRHQLGELLDRYQVREVLIAVADPPGDLLEYVRALCAPREVAWKVVTAGVIVV